MNANNILSQIRYKKTGKTKLLSLDPFIGERDFFNFVVRLLNQQKSLLTC
jgi:hypothetical protein